jgi:simple sugar transport system ATP-binding protein
MAEEFLTLENISKSFSGVRALRNVDLTIHRGEIRCLVGENGSGKSTLIKVMSGVVTPDEGRIVIEGRHYRSLQPINAIREGIQTIYQDFSLFPNLTVAENVALNYQLSRKRRLLDWKEVHSVAEEAIGRIGVEIDLNAYVGDLSVADKQLIAISRALLQNAELIIMDEPTSALTGREIDSLFRVVRNLQETGISILFVSHKLNEVLEIADSVTVLRNGMKVADGPVSDFDWRTLAYHMTGREIRETSYEGPDELPATSLLKVEGLTKKGKFSDISFQLFAGEIVGITGLLDSGRTELATALFGLEPADSGSVYIDGQPVKIKNTHDATSRGIGYVPEDRLTQGLFLPQSISKNIIASKVHDLVGRFKLLDSNKVESEVNSWVRDLSIVTPSPLLPAQSLSGGNQQRVVLAKWLATMPKILILNGPTVGVDVGSKADIHSIIRKLAQEGMGVLIMSDDIPEILQNCNRILLMRRGRIVEEFLGSSISETELAQRLTGV